MRLVGLKSLRKSKGFTQEQMASELNVPYNRYIVWEQCRSFPKQTSQLEMLIEYFNCTLDELFGRNQ